MRKLRLELDSIQVDSFGTSQARPWKGTVRAQGDEADTVFWEIEGFGNEITAPPPKTLPPDVTCDTCYRTCITACTCETNPGCTGCT